MPINLSAVVMDAHLAECFTVLRTSGQWVNGGWAEGPTTSIPVFGVITIADAKALEMVPEGDRITGSVQIFCNTPIYPTAVGDRPDAPATSDKVRWHGTLYRLMNVSDWCSWGFYSAIGVRMEGA